ncbi:uncharacterized protein LY89DRAFT_558574, partial [Mollisia scopiformis]
VLVLSHFFWIPGAPMQRSIRGMLSSLVHQLLTRNRPMIPVLLEEDETLQHKDSIYDWSKEELQRTLLKVLSNRAYASCLFIDGLDEVDPVEGQAALVQVLEKIRAQTNVNLCVSSRPESILQESLKNYPKLRLQDLTNSDIRHMVEERLSPFKDRLAKMKIDERGAVRLDILVSKITGKADGVFLWATLVTKSLERGIANGDDWATLNERLDVLPRAMNELYSHMWSRLNEDEKLYREQAATYFAFFL